MQTVQNNNNEQQLSNQSDNQLPKEIIWRRNAPYFYQLLYTDELNWPSLTVQWKPDPQLNASNRKPTDQQFVTFLTYGTMNNTSPQQDNFIHFAKVRIPNQQYLHRKYKERPPNKNDAVKKNQGEVQHKIQVIYSMVHPGQVNRIRRNPKMTQLLASRTANGDILIISEFKMKKGDNPLNPQITLKGHNGQGYAVEWSPNKQTLILGGSYDKKLSLWNIQQRSASKTVQPFCDFIFHQHQIQGVSFNKYHSDIFLSCDDGGYEALWDLRNSNKPIHTFKNHEGPIYSVQFSPLNQYMWGSGGSDGMAKVWDLRNTSEALFEWNTQGQISQFKWSCDDKTTTWTVNDKLMTLWDVCEGKAKYVHGGHLKKVNEMSIHPNLGQVFASVDDDNAIHVFEPNQNYK